MNRREILKASAISAVSLAGASLLAKTPRQAEGPFHPMNIDNDLRSIKAGATKAAGQEILIQGRVINDRTKEPLDKVMIEIWQADSQGKYNHPNDPLEVIPDPNFQFYGRTFTDADGRYFFYSIKPGSYPADEKWWRPPHIHFRFLRRGYLDLTTQMYFAGESLNDLDKILQRLPKLEQQKLIVKMIPSSDPQVLVGQFDIEMEPA